MATTTKQLRIGGTVYELRLSSGTNQVTAQAFHGDKPASHKFTISYEPYDLDMAKEVGISNTDLLTAIVRSAIEYVRDNVK